MNIFGRSLGDYVRIAKGLLVLTAAVGLIRLGLSLAGAPTSLTVWFSLTAVLFLGVVYIPILVHRQAFGGYRQVLVLLVLQFAVAETIVAAGIAITALTGVSTIFSIPEYSGGGEPNHWAHAAVHLIGGPTIFPLIMWLPASLILWIARRATGRRP